MHMIWHYAPAKKHVSVLVKILQSIAERKRVLRIFKDGRTVSSIKVAFNPVDFLSLYFLLKVIGVEIVFIFIPDNLEFKF